MKCVKSYFKKCGTPLHREISDLVMDMVVHRVSKFCDNSQQKSRKFVYNSNDIFKNVTNLTTL